MLDSHQACTWRSIFITRLSQHVYDEIFARDHQYWSNRFVGGKHRGNHFGRMSMSMACLKLWNCRWAGGTGQMETIGGQKIMEVDGIVGFSFREWVCQGL